MRWRGVSHCQSDYTLQLLGQVSLGRCLRPRPWTTPTAWTQWSTSMFPSTPSSSGWRPAGLTCPVAGFTTQTLTRPKYLWVRHHSHLHLHHEGHIVDHMIRPLRLFGLAITGPKLGESHGQTVGRRDSSTAKKWSKIFRHIDRWSVIIESEIMSFVSSCITCPLYFYTCSRIWTLCVYVCVHADLAVQIKLVKVSLCLNNWTCESSESDQFTLNDSVKKKIN